MRIRVAAADVRPGDHIADAGRVATVNVYNSDVTITMDWLDAPHYTFGLDCCVWIDRKTEAIA